MAKNLLEPSIHVHPIDNWGIEQLVFHWCWERWQGKKGAHLWLWQPAEGPLVAKEVLTQKTHDKFTHKNSIRQLLGYAPKVLCDYFLCFWWFLKKSWDYWVHLYTYVLDGHSLQWDNGQPYRIHILGTMPKAKHVNSTCSVKNREYSTFCRGGKYNMIGSLGGVWMSILVDRFGWTRSSWKYIYPPGD